MVPEEDMLITWQRWNALEILEHNEVEYDQVLIVDADSIVHPSILLIALYNLYLQIILSHPY